MKEKILTLITLALLCCAIGPEAQAAKIKRKGRFLHTEIVGYDDQTSFRATLQLQEASSFPILKITRLTLRTIKEIKVFETVIDEINTAHDNQHVRDYRDLTVVPNEYIKANPSTRQDTIVEGPFANTTFLIDGTPMTTDKNGFVVDKRQRLLKRFDDLTINQVNVEIVHPKCGTVTTTFTRLIIKPEEKIIPDYKKHDSKATLDVLEALGIDSAVPKKPDTNPLDVTCTYPQDIMPGDFFPITVTVINKGRAIAGNLTLATFSRETWLDGTLFYFGNMKPGQRRSFVRFVQAPETFMTGQSFALLAPWDTVRPQPAQAKLITITH